MFTSFPLHLWPLACIFVQIGFYRIFSKMTFTQKALWQCGMPLYQFNVALIRIYLSTTPHLLLETGGGGVFGGFWLCHDKVSPLDDK